MALSLKPKYLSRYKDIVSLLLRYGNEDFASSTVSDMARSLDLGDEASDEPVTDEVEKAQRLASDLEQLGPTFIKLGQLLSTRPDLLPETYRIALTRLQDSVEPIEYAIVEETISAELGVRVSKAFGSFDERPLASASLGQVHRATLLDGREVAVKVLRPGVEQQIADDLGALSEIAAFLERHLEVARRYRFTETVASFEDSLNAEVDYRREASNLRRLSKNLERFGRLRVPRAIEDYSSRRVLTMEYVSGIGVDDVSPVVLADLDGEALADELFEAYLSQILVDGLFHADPHPGNLLLTPDHTISLLDLGMVGYVPDGLRESIMRLLLAIADGDGEAAAEIIVEASRLRQDADVAGFRTEIAQKVMRQRDASLGNLQVGTVVIELAQIAANHGVLVPSSINLIAKALLNLDLIGRTLAPDFNPMEAINRHAADILSRRLKESASLQSLFRTAMEAKDFASKLPSRLNTILENVAGNNLHVQVDAIDEDRLIMGLQQVANRVTAGLILAALIVGAAMLMQVETPGFRILGYPGLAIVLFVAAAVGGFGLLVTIWKSERAHR